MSHRAQQIVDAVVALLQANSILQASVVSYRALTLSEFEGELPAVNVSVGADDPISEIGVTNTAYVDSLLELLITAVAMGSSEDELLPQLQELRRQIHVALYGAGVDLGGLSFVMGLRYGGAEAPIVNIDGDRIGASLLTRWRVHYRMNFADPG
jgi:hypothetical protein